jgi:prepilin-type N-terminal cleavage/methylation domain-containing protein
MTARSSTASRLGGAPRGFTLTEVSICVVIVGVMFAAVMHTVAQANVAQFKIVERSRGRQLARMLLAEIVTKSYEETDAAPLFGKEGAEDRATFDDVDDYHALDECPPTNRDKTTIGMPKADTWRRTVAITWINPATLAKVSPQVETAAKRILVTTYHNGLKVAECTAVRTNAP